MSALYQLAAEYSRLLETAEDGEDIGAALDAISDAIEVKVDRIACVLASLEGDETAAREEAKRLLKRATAVEANRERLRDYLRTQMDLHGVAKMRTPRFTISVSDGPERVEIEDESAVPETFVRTKREIDRRAVLEAFKADGECVPGTRISRGRTLRIR